MLTKEQCSYNVVIKEVFKKALPESNIPEELLNVNQQYLCKIKRILSISLNKFVKRFSYQKGVIFGLGKMQIIMLSLY